MIGGPIALLRKEMRSMLPWWGASALFVVVEAIEDIGAERLPADQIERGMEGWAIVISIFAFAVGHAIAASEHREGTIELLDSLPTRRATAWGAKVLAGGLPIAAVWLATVAMKIGILVSNADAHTASWGWALAAEMSPLGALVMGFFGYGLLMSWLDAVGWGLLMLGGMAHLFLSVLIPATEPFHPWSPRFSVLHFTGDHARFPLGVTAFWLMVAVLGTSLSGVVFLGPGELVVRGGARVASGLRAAAIGFTACVFFVCSGLAGVGGLASSGDRLLAATEELATPHHRFLFRSRDRDAAIDVVAGAEASNALVRQLLGGAPPVSVDVEMMESMPFHLGQFNGGKIRMRPENGRPTFIHELTHAYEFSLSAHGELDRGDSVRFFDEGLARWVETHIEPPEEAENQRRLAAAMWRSGQADFGLLCRYEYRSKEYDPVQIYPLGFTFVEALVAVGGPGAPKRILQGMALEHGDGPALWYRLASRAGVDLDAVIDRWHSDLAAVDVEVPDVYGRVENGVVEVAEPTGRF
jgi:hypothetical protein